MKKSKRKARWKRAYLLETFKSFRIVRHLTHPIKRLRPREIRDAIRRDVKSMRKLEAKFGAE